MRRIGSWMRGVFQLVAAAGIVCLAAGPEVVREKLEAVLASTWKVAGKAMVEHDLARMTSGLDTTRGELQHAQARRAALARWLSDLETRRQAARLRAEQVQELLERITSLLDRLPDGEERTDLEREVKWQRQRSLETSREIAQLDAAIDLLTDENVRAGRHIQATQDRLFVRESELALLRAAGEARQLRHELAGLGDIPPCWEAQAGRVAGLLQPLDPRLVTKPMPTGHLAALPQSQGNDD
jgi:hypothetical protein